jgi:hypothetical protein
MKSNIIIGDVGLCFFIRDATMKKNISKILILITCLTIVVFSFYYLKYYAPYEQAIQKKIKHINSQLNPHIADNLKILTNEDDVLIYVSKSMVKEYLFHENMMQNIEWHLHSFLWLYINKMKYSSNDMLALFVHHAPYYAGKGLFNSSEYYYNKNINELTKEQLNKLLLVSKKPSRYPKLEIK